MGWIWCMPMGHPVGHPVEVQPDERLTHGPGKRKRKPRQKRRRS